MPQLRGGKNLALEIVRALEADIDSGTLSPGDRLPTQRELAERLGVALGTVTRAYSFARTQGLITGTIGRGTFVTARQQDRSQLIDFSRNLVYRDQRGSNIRALLSAIGDPAQIAILLDDEQHPAGVAHHRSAAARWMSRPSFNPAAEDIVICSGVQHGMHVLLATITRPGDTIATEAVTYAGIKAIAALSGLQLTGLPLDAEGLDPRAFADACRRGAKVLYTTPTLQNPTGTTFVENRRRQIARIAEEHGVPIIEDDVYGFLAPDAPPPIAAYAPANTYYLVGTSKSIAPGIRVGYIACPPDMARSVANTVRTTVWETSPIMSAIVTRWIEDGTAQRVAECKRSEVLARNQIARTVLPDVAPPLAASPHWWINLPQPWRPDDLTSECREHGLAISPASTFAINREKVPTAVRICLAAVPDKDRLQQGLQIFRDVLQRGPRTHFPTT